MTLFTLQHLLSVDHKTELQLQKFCRLATHDRVNYSVEKSEVNIDKEAMEITLKLTIDTAISSVMDYFEIFMGRMLLCRKAAEKLGLQFKLMINEQQLI